MPPRASWTGYLKVSPATIPFASMEGMEKIEALILGELRGRGWMYKGKVGTGLNDQERQQHYRDLVHNAPLPKLPENGPEDAIWRSTGMRCRVRFFEKTGTGKLRAPVLVEMAG